MTSSIYNNISFKSIYRFANRLNVILEIKIDDKSDSVYYLPSKPNPTIGVSTSAYDYFNDKKRVEWELATSILHEFGHLIVCAPSRRRKKNYGIPSYPENYWNYEEIKAQLVDYKLCKLLKIKPPHSYKQILNNDGFIDSYDKEKKEKLINWWKEEGNKRTMMAFKYGVLY